jgi:hypothetical protein
MAQRKQSVVLTATAHRHCQALVDAGVYVSLDDAASDLIMQQVRGANPPIGTVSVPTVPQTTPQTMSTTPVLASTAPIDAAKTAGARFFETL